MIYLWDGQLEGEVGGHGYNNHNTWFEQDKHLERVWVYVYVFVWDRERRYCEYVIELVTVLCGMQEIWS